MNVGVSFRSIEGHDQCPYILHCLHFRIHMGTYEEEEAGTSDRIWKSQESASHVHLCPEAIFRGVADTH